MKHIQASFVVDSRVLREEDRRWNGRGGEGLICEVKEMMSLTFSLQTLCLTEIIPALSSFNSWVNDNDYTALED